MVQGFVDGANEFRDFAADIEELSHRVPDAIERALEETGEDLIREIRFKLQAGSTAKGGTLNSRTSPYWPGGSNDSTDDPYHLSDREAWVSRAVGRNTLIVAPREAVQDRAKWLEYGTSDHGPVGDNPMYFWVAGTKIVVWADDVASIEGAEGQEIGVPQPGEVEGVEPQMYFHKAVQEVQDKKYLTRNITKELRKEAQLQFG